MTDTVNEKAVLAWQSAKALKALANPGAAGVPYAPTQHLRPVADQTTGLRLVYLTPAILTTILLRGFPTDVANGKSTPYSPRAHHPQG
jgi:hypothetical protein